MTMYFITEIWDLNPSATKMKALAIKNVSFIAVFIFFFSITLSGNFKLNYIFLFIIWMRFLVRGRTWWILLHNDRKSRHRSIKKQRRYERLAATQIIYAGGVGGGLKLKIALARTHFCWIWRNLVYSFTKVLLVHIFDNSSLLEQVYLEYC